MDHVVAKHILSSQNLDELKSIRKRAPSGLDEYDRGHAERQLETGLREGMKALGARMGSEADLKKAKERLLTAMEEAGALVGLGSRGALLRGGDLMGAAPHGSISGQALREVLSPERAPRPGTLYGFKASAGGALSAVETEPNSRVMPNGSIALSAATIAMHAVNRVDTAIGGFGAIFKAAAECASVDEGLERSVGAQGKRADAWSREELSTHLTAQFEGVLLPLGPESNFFPKPLERADMGAKLGARRVAGPSPGSIPAGPSAKAKS